MPVPTLLRLLYLKHRYGLGYESLCKEVGDSISWRRFCRIPLDQPVPHPTTLSKLVRRAGPEVIGQLNAALLGKLAGDKLLRARKLRVDTTVVEADIDYPTDADLLEQAVRTVGGLVRRLKARGAARRTAFRDRSRSAGRRMRQLAQTLRRRTGVAMDEIDRLTAEVAGIARQTLREVAAVQRAAHRATARRPGDGWLARLAGQLDQTVTLTGRLLDQADQRLAGNRSIPDRVVSLADPDARPIRKGKPRSPTQFGYTLLLAEDERGFVADHQLSKGNPADAPQLHPGRASSGRAAGPAAGHRGRRPRVRVRRQRPRAGRPRRPAHRAAAHRHAQQVPSRAGADSGVQTHAQLARGDRGAHQPPQALVWAAAHPAAPLGRRPGLGGAWDLRLQLAAHDRGGGMKPGGRCDELLRKPVPPTQLSRTISWGSSTTAAVALR